MHLFIFKFCKTVSLHPNVTQDISVRDHAHAVNKYKQSTDSDGGFLESLLLSLAIVEPLIDLDARNAQSFSESLLMIHFPVGS